MSIKDNIKKVRDNVYEVPGSVNKKITPKDKIGNKKPLFYSLKKNKLNEAINLTGKLRKIKSLKD